MSKRIEPGKKTCLYCGAAFEFGGRGRPNKRQKFCSRQCQALGRMVTPKVRTLGERDAAYLAGLIDGEGCILLFNQRDRVRPSLRLTIGNTDRPVLEWCAVVVGAGNIIKQPRRLAQHTQCWRWEIYSQNAVDILRQLLPHLRIKGEQALRAIESQMVRRFNDERREGR